ncbi:MAG: hypothetical protein PVH87_16300 [Desulfobacteraceae bacterium]
MHVVLLWLVRNAFNRSVESMQLVPGSTQVQPPKEAWEISTAEGSSAAVDRGLPAVTDGNE